MRANRYRGMNSNERVISVVIVSWNARAFLEECLASIARAKRPGVLEVIVVDNASSDGSAEMVETQFPEVRLQRNASNLGFAAANNIGIRMASGEHIFLINSDVTVAPDCLEKLVKFMDEHPAVGVAGPTMLTGGGAIGRSCRGFPTVWRMACHAVGLDRLIPQSPIFSGYTMRYWKQNSTREVDILGGWFLCVRRAALEEVGLLDERFFFYAEDMDWCRRFRLKGWKVMFVADAQSVHYGGGSSKVAPTKYYIQEQRADLQLWRKHNAGWRYAIYYGTCIVHQALRCAGNGLLALFSGGSAERITKARRNARCLWWYVSGAKD